MLVPRHDVYRAIDTERTYQDKCTLPGSARLHGSSPIQDAGAFILCMEECLAQARAAWYKPGGDKDCLPFVRKTTALGVQMMELYGAPERKPG